MTTISTLCPIFVNIRFLPHLGTAAVRLRISKFALSLLLAGAEPEELATAVAASLRGTPGIAFGDVIGANIAICLVALGVGATIAPLPFGKQVRRYAVLSLPLGGIATISVWDGKVDRLEGGLLVGLYILYVAIIWSVERRPPTLGETEEIQEAQEKLTASESPTSRSRVGKDLLLILAGVIVMAVGATILVEAVRRISSAEATQTKLGLTLVGFATAFELIVLAWSSCSTWHIGGCRCWCRRLVCLQRYDDARSRRHRPSAPHPRRR